MTTHLHTMAGQHHIEELGRRAEERRAFLPLQESTERTNEHEDDAGDSPRRFRRSFVPLRPAA
jgi:hypothetical protein